MRSLKLILAALATGAAFEAMTLLATQDKAVRAVSPWQDDPYDVAVSFALVTVPLLAVATAVGLPAWRAPGAPGREQRIVRAAAALIAVVGLTLASEWAAVAARAHARVWNGWTTALIAGLAALTPAAAGVGIVLWRRWSPLAPGDWLDDLPLLGRRPGLVERIRARATTLFAALSLFAAAGIVGAQAVGERWSDPLLIGWALLVETASLFAFCVAANAAAGFIRRTRSRADTPILAGTAGLVLMTAFRDPLWTAIAHRPVTSVPLLVALTVGAGLLAAAATLVRRPA
ncbi:hypothetical protein ACQP1P_28315 [Dactylosporangium sp. CA-052675]|uniref:hypothetical protein n=1 Tax=Dactylosporangium sp. CA-052675 TaxID=3239927 RepID=UPI003D934AB5